MSNNLMEQLALAVGSCCVYHYYRTAADEKKGTKVITLHLGIDERNVRKWKERMRKGDCTCEGLSTCMANKSWLTRRLYTSLPLPASSPALCAVFQHLSLGPASPAGATESNAEAPPNQSSTPLQEQ